MGDARHNVAAYGSPGQLRHKFTGKERDTESGMDYFLARYYSGPMGRFTGPDAPLLDQDPGSPQSWNLYTYVRNNPLKFIDPTGQAVKLLGETEDERDDELNAIKSSLVNSKVAGNLEVTGNEKDGFFVGVKGGKIRDFQKAGDLETDLGILIAHETVVEFGLDDATSTKGGFLGTGLNFDVGAQFGGGVTHRSDATFSGNIQTIVDPNDIRHRDSSTPVQTLGEAVAHELLGHALGFVSNPKARGATTNRRSIDIENKARSRGGLGRGVRTRHKGGFPTK